MAFDFDAAFTKIAAVSNASTQQIAKWRTELLAVSKATAQAPKELADALFFLASAGLQANQIMATLKASAKASAAGLGETADIARLLANVLNAYADSGLTAAHAMDILVAAVREGTADTDEFASAMGRLLPIASKAGVGFEQLAAALAALSNIGLDVNEGVTAMRGLIQGLAAATPAAAKALKDLGISTEELRRVVAEKGLLAALQLLIERSEGNIDVLRKIIPNVRALTGALGLTGQNAEKVAEIFDRVKNSTGSLGKAFKETAESDAFQLTKKLNELKIVLLEVGQKLLPIVIRVAERIGELVQRFTELPEATQNTILKFAGIAAAAGPLLRIFGGLLSVVGKLAIGFARLAGAASGAAAASGAVAGIGGAGVVGRIAALAAAAGPAAGGLAFALAALFGVIIANSDKAAGALRNFFEGAKDFGKDAGAFFDQAFDFDQSTIEVPLSEIQALADQLRGAFRDMFTGGDVTGAIARFKEELDGSIVGALLGAERVARIFRQEIIGAFVQGKIDAASLVEALVQIGQVDLGTENITALMRVLDGARDLKTGDIEKIVRLFEQIDVVGAKVGPKLERMVSNLLKMGDVEGAIALLTQKLNTAKPAIDKAAEAAADAQQHAKGMASAFGGAADQAGRAGANAGRAAGGFKSAGERARDAKEPVEQLGASVRGLPKGKKIDITVNTKQASGAISALRGQLDSIDQDRTIWVNIRAKANPEGTVAEIVAWVKKQLQALEGEIGVKLRVDLSDVKTAEQAAKRIQKALIEALRDLPRGQRLQLLLDLKEMQPLLRALGVSLDDILNKVKVWGGMTLPDFRAWIESTIDGFNTVNDLLAEFAQQTREAAEAIAEAEQRLRDLQQSASATPDEIAEATAALQELREQGELTAAEMLAAIQEQLQAMQEYAANWEALLARGLPADLIQQLQEMGLEGAELIRALLSMTDEEFAAFLEAWKEAAELAKEIAGEIEKEIEKKGKKKIKVGVQDDATVIIRHIIKLLEEIQDKTVTVTVIEAHKKKGGGGGAAAGGIATVAAQLGGIATRPTLLPLGPFPGPATPRVLVGEGPQMTPFGQGTEAFLPFDSRGIGILGEASAMGFERVLPKLAAMLSRAGGEPVLIVQPVVFRDDFRQEVRAAGDYNLSRRLRA